MKKIYLIGAGQIGSRHLQALSKVKIPLEITVIDPSLSSLKSAQGCFEETVRAADHTISYTTNIPTTRQPIDIAIIATTSGHRRKAMESLLAQNSVRFFILEKLLFQKKEDFQTIQTLLDQTGSIAFVNCMMRSVPLYRNLKTDPKQKKIIYSLTSGEIGLVTSAVHFLDHVGFLTGCFEYTVDTSLLDAKPIESKRQGYLELTGTMIARFKDGSITILTRYKEPSPTSLSILSEDQFILTNFEIGKAFQVGTSIISTRKDNWKWLETTEVIPYQSKMTTAIVEDILNTGTCTLATYNEAVKIHLPLLEALGEFLEHATGKKMDIYPFT